MDTQIWVALIAGGSAIIAPILLVLMKQRVQEKESYQAASFEKALDSMHMIYNCLNDVVYKSQADRAMVLYSTNGGGIPHAASDLYVTVSHEITRNELSLKRDIQSLPDRSWLGNNVIKAIINHMHGI